MRSTGRSAVPGPGEGAEPANSGDSERQEAETVAVGKHDASDDDGSAGGHDELLGRGVSWVLHAGFPGLRCGGSERRNQAGPRSGFGSNKLLALADGVTLMLKNALTELHKIYMREVIL
ncbi:hypothetical protein GCM10027084_04950 [Pseudoxanthomonas sangjuensis]